MGSACIAAKNRQCAFLIAEKWTGHILNSRKMSREYFEYQKNEQGAAPFEKCLGETLK